MASSEAVDTTAESGDAGNALTQKEIPKMNELEDEFKATDPPPTKEEIQLARQQLAAMKAYRLKLQHEVVDLKAEVAKVEIIKEQNQKLVTQEELLKQQAEALQKKQDELALQLAQFEQMKKDHQKKLDDQAFDASEGNRKKKATKAILRIDRHANSPNISDPVYSKDFVKQKKADDARDGAGTATVLTAL